MRGFVLLVAVVVLITTAAGTLAADRWIGYTAENDVSAVACEGDRYVWCGSYGGVARFDVTTGEKIVYTRADGLTDNWVEPFGPSVTLDLNLPALPTGNYFWFAAMTKPGYVSQIVGDIAIASWRFE